MACSNWAQLLPHVSPPPNQMEKQWWSSSGGRLYQSGVASLGVGEVMNDTPLVLKGCMTVVALALLLQYVVHSWSKVKGRGGGGKVRCHWVGVTSQVRWTVNGGRTLQLRAIVVVIPLLLVIAGGCGNKPRTWRYLYCYSTH